MAQDATKQAPAPTPSARALLPLILPALVVGVGASLLFLAVSGRAEQLQDVLRQNLPDALGIGRCSAFWMIVTLTATGVPVGLAAWKVPGHAGPDPATHAEHGGFSRLRHPMPALPVGGLVLGLLRALGGHLGLFKGLDEAAEPAHDQDGRSAGEFATMAVVKPAALLVAVSCGLRGGRIFPAVFAGGALGPCAHALGSGVQPAVGVSSGVLGMLLAITRQGWVSLFTAAVPVASPAILALLCIASLPARLLVTGRPQTRLRKDGTAIR